MVRQRKISARGASRDFFCSDHGAPVRSTNATVKYDEPSTYTVPIPVKKIVDISEPRSCKNKGCGKTFQEINNHENAWEYHPGPAVFHNRLRGWKCCDVHVREFDEFMSIPSCTKGCHNAEATATR